MAAEFKPLFAAATTPAPNAPRDFAPFSPKPAATAVHEECSTPKGELKVELKRTGDRVTQIRIQCRCGELIELDCEY